MDWYSIGQRIRSKRLQCNLTQEQLANCAGTSNIYICRIENGIAKPTLPKLITLCKVLGCPLSYMVEGHDIECYDKHAAHISKMLDGCSPYMVRMIEQIIESIKNNESINYG
jgi:transcriptional regulator with XRE-family HTH domain